MNNNTWSLSQNKEQVVFDAVMLPMPVENIRIRDVEMVLDAGWREEVKQN